MILKINEYISEGTLDKFIQSYNELDNKDILTVFFQSRGGCIDSAEAILELIKMYSKITILIGYGELCSCAFDLFFKATCKKTLIKGCIGMCHQSSVKVDINENGHLHGHEARALQNQIISFFKKQTDYIGNIVGLTDAEKSKIKKGIDLWIQPERMEELLIYNLKQKLQQT